MTSISAIMSAIVTALAADHGTYDLSGDDQVQRGRYTEPPAGGAVLPFAAVASPAIGSEPGPPINVYERTATIDIEVWAGVADTSTPTRTIAGETLADELAAALEAARVDKTTALWRCRTFSVRTVNLNDDADPLSPGFARVLLVVELTYSRSSGV